MLHPEPIVLKNLEACNNTFYSGLTTDNLKSAYPNVIPLQ
jgi:hypothetical protein